MITLRRDFLLAPFLEKSDLAGDVIYRSSFLGRSPTRTDLVFTERAMADYRRSALGNRLNVHCSFLTILSSSQNQESASKRTTSGPLRVNDSLQLTQRADKLCQERQCGCPAGNRGSPDQTPYIQRAYRHLRRMLDKVS